MYLIKTLLLSLIIIEQIISYGLLVKKFRDYFNPILFTFVFIYLPFCLSHLKLSILQVQEYNPVIYVIFLFSSTFILFISIFLKPSIRKMEKELIGKQSLWMFFAILLNIIYITTYFYENLIANGVLVPLLNVEDGGAHLNGLPYFREVNTVFRAFMPLFNFYLYYKSKKKIYLLLTLITIFVPLSRGSRIAVISSFLIIAAFMLRKINIKKIFIIFIAFFVLLNSAMSIGDYRRSYTTESYGYEVGITNSFLNNNPIGELISWYYGYYSLSIYNFNLSLNTWLHNEIYFYGLANLNGLLSFFINVYPTPEEFNSRVTYVSGAANVPTSMYFSLVDFGIIGILVFDVIFYSCLFAIYRKSTNNSYYRLVYSYLLLQVINFAFYSSFYAVYMYAIIIILCLLKGLHRKKLED
ncbi:MULTISPECIES: O-antigen polymerase [Priestia]|uniref:O-antigen polymerase n=1 Tax=Priestia TaxID=2800373 RepID=UPI00112D48D6|nr:MULTISPECIES: O-antigen polymerase [Priestia]